MNLINVEKTWIFQYYSVHSDVVAVAYVKRSVEVLTDISPILVRFISRRGGRKQQILSPYKKKRLV